jgi:hypothetical protein
MREKLGSCSFCIRWSTRGFAISILLLIASIYLRITPLIVISAAVFTFFSVLTTLHFIFYVRRREKCIRRVSGESRRRFISTAFKLVVGLALYSMLGKIPEISAKPEIKPIRSVELAGKDLEEAVGKATASKDLRNVLDGFKADLRSAKAIRHFLSFNGRELTLLAVVVPISDNSIATYYEYSEPVSNIRTRAYLISIENEKAAIKRISINNHLIETEGSCVYECSTDSDCPWGETCISECCSWDQGCLGRCCGPCMVACAGSLASCLTCVLLWCPLCAIIYCCTQVEYICTPTP